MKMITAIVSSDDSLRVSRALAKGGFFVTKLATTGGFLMSGNTTFLIGTEDDMVAEAIEIIRKNSETRTRIVPGTASYGVEVFSSTPIEVQVGGATVFVMDVEQYLKL